MSVEARRMRRALIVRRVLARRRRRNKTEAANFVEDALPPVVDDEVPASLEELMSESGIEKL